MSKSKKSVSTKPRKGRGLKIFVAILCIIVIGALAASVTFNVMLYKKVSGQSDNKVPPLDGGNVIVTPEDPTPNVALLSIDPFDAIIAAHDTVAVPVTVTPDVEDENLKIDWSIRFTDAASEWAADKRVTDYAAILPTADGSLTAHINVKQAFAEQIKVTAAVRGNTQVKVSCTVDYVCKYVVESFEITTVDSEYNECAARLTPKLVKSIGTIDEEVTKSVTIKYADNLLKFLDDGIHQPLIKLVNGSYMSVLANYTETGVDTLTPKVFGIASDTYLGNDLCVSFLGLGADRYKLHMERLFFYHLISLSPDLATAPLSIFERNYTDNRWNNANYCNQLFNAFVDNAMKNVLDYEELSNGARIPIYQYGLRRFGSALVLPEAFKVTCTITSEHNNITYEQLIPFAFSVMPSEVGNLEIDPPSIIV